MWIDGGPSMMGTKTLAEIKKELIGRFGFLPDVSREAMSARLGEIPTPISELNELEKSLLAALDELEREIQERKRDQTK
jgi:hypothetical protein